MLGDLHCTYGARDLAQEILKALVGGTESAPEEIKLANRK